MAECISEGETERRNGKSTEKRRWKGTSWGRASWSRSEKNQEMTWGEIMSGITERITSKEEEERIKKIRGSKYNIYKYERVRIDRRREFQKKRKKRD